MDKIKNNPVYAIAAAILLGVLSLKLLVEYSTKKVAAAETVKVQAALTAIKAQPAPQSAFAPAKAGPRNVASIAKPKTPPISSTLAASNKLLAASAPKFKATARNVKIEPLRQTTGYATLSRGTVPSNHNLPVRAGSESNHELKPSEIATFERELASTAKAPLKTSLKTKKNYASKAAVKN